MRDIRFFACPSSSTGGGSDPPVGFAVTAAAALIVIRLTPDLVTVPIFLLLGDFLIAEGEFNLPVRPPKPMVKRELLKVVGTTDIRVDRREAMREGLAPCWGSVKVEEILNTNLV